MGSTSPARFLSWSTSGQAEPGLRAELPAPAADLVVRAAGRAETWHGDRLRPTGDRYMVHLLETMEILLRGAGVTDPEVLAAALLHDVVEDTPITTAEIEAEFGPTVAGHVGRLTKPPAAPGQPEPTAREDYLRRLRDAPTPAIWIKLADRASNVQSLQRMPRDFQHRYHAETITYLVPLAQGHPYFEPWFHTWASTL